MSHCFIKCTNVMIVWIKFGKASLQLNSMQSFSLCSNSKINELTEMFVQHCTCSICTVVQ